MNLNLYNAMTNRNKTKIEAMKKKKKYKINIIFF